jgi:hypothetical protein
VITQVWGAATEEEIFEYGQRSRSDPQFDPNYRQLADISGVTEIRVSSNALETMSRQTVNSGRLPI